MTTEVIPSGSDLQGGPILVERVLYDIIKLGLEEVHADPSLTDDLFFQFDTNTRNDIHKFFEEHRVAVRQNFPQDELTLPMVAVVNGDDSEQAAFDLLGDDLLETFTPDIGETNTLVGHAVQGTYRIFCIAEKDSNAALWLYYVIKALLILHRDQLQTHGLHNVVMSGADVTLREDLFPQRAFARVLTLSCIYFFSVPVTEKVATKLIMRIFTEDAVSGIKTELEPEEET